LEKGGFIMTTQHLDLAITGSSSLVGRVVGIDAWAEEMRIPNRKVRGAFLTGDDVRKILGLERKSWDPELFRDFERVVDVAREALAAASLAPADVEMLVVATSTPYEVQLDADAFRLMQRLGIPDAVPPIQLGAGCGGMARVMSIAARAAARTILVVTYEISSLYMKSPVYLHNERHPHRDKLWMSPALFSDGAAAVVLRREPGAGGCLVYSRDALAFGDAPGFTDRLVHYPGGGGLAAPGLPGSDELACYGMAGEETKRYYEKGMMLNHEALARARPRYLHEVARVYPHQSSPRLVDGFIDALSSRAGVPRDKFGANVHDYGNLVIPSTPTMLHHDLRDGRVRAGDEVCFTVVGAGPERGAFIVPLA
jgi:3-oxoacyl-[acyl-carrier-protein] synthase-3